jgi:hypothetical protein
VRRRLSGFVLVGLAAPRFPQENEPPRDCLTATRFLGKRGAQDRLRIGSFHSPTDCSALLRSFEETRTDLLRSSEENEGGLFAKSIYVINYRHFVIVGMR